MDQDAGLDLVRPLPKIGLFTHLRCAGICHAAAGRRSEGGMISGPPMTLAGLDRQ